MGIAIRAGGHDWLEIWRTMYDRERAQGEAGADAEFARHPDTWANHARRFARASQRVPQPDGFMQLLLPRLRPTDTVADVGAGSGRYLPVLARAVARVIAVEPSGAMRAEMDRLIADEGLTNVTVIDSGWPLAEPFQADVILSAHTVYGVREVGPFLQAMDACARRACYLYLGLRHPAATLSHFWAAIHAEPRLPLPAALEAICCLHQLGLPAALELVPVRPSFRFDSLDDAVEEIRLRLRVLPEPERDARITAAARAWLIPTADGGLAPPEQPTHAAVISWSPATSAVAES
jgi:SAM-dependent methyltransferase